ncbi:MULTISPECIES: ATP-binding protein [Streptacidiphilus]|uniref:ATP-binding protein n=1 Tax=Streptacidiphilus cavernicola TaxID=3342716 RepID=A0ABV6UFN7_9ACTN|nr:ATP-binding protein [Streptacidiphilus jeojiense]
MVDSNALASHWREDVPVAGSSHLPPDVGYAKALTNQGYSFDVAVADLVDNSIDAGADLVAVHFLRSADRLHTLLVLDNGQGMNERDLDLAMTVGRRRDYGSSALGMYGTGLKAASLSHAGALTVISRTKSSRPAGRKLTSEGIEDNFRCDTVDKDFAQEQIDVYDGVIGFQGTIVRWDRVNAFETVAPGETDAFLAKATQSLERHLGLHLHRFLARGLKLDIVVTDVDTGEETQHDGVESLDPFGYKIPGRKGYPRELTAEVEGVGQVALEAHIWVAKSRLAGYAQIGSPIQRQGFYFYRNDRLVQAGGWNNLRTPESHLNLARIEVDLPAQANRVFSLDVKKEGVQVMPAFTFGVESACDAEGRTFRHYLADAEAAYRDGNSRQVVERPAIVAPGKGFDPKVKRSVREQLAVKAAEDPIRIEWTALPEDRFFELDREHNAIHLNKAFREDFNGGRRGGANDAPVTKTLLYLLLQDCFGLGRWEKKRADRIDYWNAILLSAVLAQRERLERSTS